MARWVAVYRAALLLVGDSLTPASRAEGTWHGHRTLPYAPKDRRPLP